MSAREAQLFAQGPTPRDRFIAAIAQRIDPARMQAMYLFPPIRQGAVETGVAVVAVDPLPPERPVPADETGDLFVAAAEARLAAATAVAEELIVAAEAAEAEAAVVEAEALATAAAAMDARDDASAAAEAGVPTVAADDTERDTDADDADAPMEGADARSPRPLVLTARYRLTLKGPDRGAWGFELHEQADAPLATIEMVVQGVAQRHEQAADPERLDADAVRAVLAEGPWTAAPR